MIGRTLTVLSVLLASLLLAEVASAAPVRQISGSTEIASGATATSRASCGTVGNGSGRLVGAGFTSKPLGEIVNRGLVPRGKKVKASAFNNGIGTARASVRGYCANRIATKVRSTTDTLVTGKVHNVFISCPSGQTALAGGWKPVGTPPSSWAVLNSLRQGRRNWVISVGANGPGTIRAYVICARQPVDVVARKGRKAFAVSGAASLAKASCPAGTTAFSGGFETGVDEGTPFTTPFVPLASKRRTAHRWTASGFSPVLVPEHYIRTQVLCFS